MKKIAVIMIISVLGFTFCSEQKNNAVKESDQSPVARITFLKGSVQMVRENATQTVKQGELLKTGDVIQTAGASSAEIFFKDHGIVRLDENSELSMSEISGKDASIKLSNGAAGLFMKKMDAEAEFKLETPTSVAAVRGTAFLVKTTKDESEISLFEGKIEVTNDKGSVVMDKPGSVSVQKDSTLNKDVIRPVNPAALGKMKEMAVFQKNRIMEYNNFVDEMKSTDAIQKMEAETVEKQFDRMENKSNRPNERVTEAKRAEENIVRHNTEGDPIKVPAKKDF